MFTRAKSINTYSTTRGVFTRHSKTKSFLSPKSLYLGASSILKRATVYPLSETEGLMGSLMKISQRSFSIMIWRSKILTRLGRVGRIRKHVKIIRRCRAQIRSVRIPVTRGRLRWSQGMRAWWGKRRLLRFSKLFRTKNKNRNQKNRISILASNLTIS